MTSSNLRRRILTSLTLLLLCFMMFKIDYFLIYGLIVLSVISILEFINLTKKITKKIFKKLLTNLIFIIYIFSFSLLFFLFSNFIHLKIIIFSLLIGCIASDLGGYVFGKVFKGPKLTKISPNKTISGFIGALLFTIITVPAIFYFLANHVSIYLFLVSFITSLACQSGDLLFSFLKRKANLKDTGNFLPGHGGVLDRLDGILVGIPVGFFTITLFY
tara:strand:+ start:348 stop:998 length:651 start_codon:yes stop_codon:yes gene_type:complete